TLAASILALRSAHLDDAHAGGCIKAAPAFSSATMAACFFFRGKTLQHSRSGISFGNPNDFAVNADPARPTAMCARFLFGPESLTASRAAFCLGRSDNLSIDATPPERRRHLWSRRRAASIRKIVWRRP